MSDISPELITLATQAHQRALARRRGNLTARLKDMTGDTPFVLAKGVIVLEVAHLVGETMMRKYHIVSTAKHWEGDPWLNQRDHGIAISAVIAAYDRLPSTSEPKRCGHCLQPLVTFNRAAKFCNDGCRRLASAARGYSKRTSKSDKRRSK